ncbi:MAG: hypothetical protein IBX48_04960 [Thiomicrospira sp.]|uniref:TorF family putative porin n=1 Tax=Thiomicrospira sp. TaxID=935 RepID=UPI0019F5CF13|nr:TorF family putative porin [Thiomicrospira sp.]MBE0493673.1 hypothetical protein [Thiomicrospira sp.]
MKQIAKLKTLVLSMAMAGSSLAVLAPATVQAGVTGNVGLVSQYIFRGAPQSAGAAAQAGLDYEHESGAYLGLWASDVDDKATGANELEYDIYGGYETELSGVTLGAGFTLYRYTQEEFDTPYDEVNLWAGYGPFTFTYDIGQNKDAAADGGDIDYSVMTLSAEYNGMYALYGMGSDFMGEDTDHSWIELGYGAEVAPGTDVSIALINSSKEGSGYSKDGSDKANTMMVVGFTKTFDIM